jgi:hypothetical protein
LELLFIWKLKAGKPESFMWGDLHNQRAVRAAWKYEGDGALHRAMMRTTFTLWPKRRSEGRYKTAELTRRIGIDVLIER